MPLLLGTVVVSDLVRVVLLLLINERVVECLVALEGVVVDDPVVLVAILLVEVVVVLRNVDPVEVVVLMVYPLDWRVVVVVNGLALCLVLLVGA